jgi:hypothetical protein
MNIARAGLFVDHVGDVCGAERRVPDREALPPHLRENSVDNLRINM